MRGKLTKRLLPAFLALAMILTLLPGEAFALPRAAEVTGSISATVRLDYDQTLEALRSRGVQAELWYEKTLLGAIDLATPGEKSLTGNYTALVSHRARTGSDQPGYLDFTVDGLPLGTYTLRFTGKGYVPYEESLTMTNYARHLTVGTGDATFTLGDVNGDGRVDSTDLERLSAALGSKLRQDLDTYDLSGDGVIDIVDLSYVYRMLIAHGGSESLETVLLSPPASSLEGKLHDLGVTISEGSLEDLFVSNGQAVTFYSDGPIVLPLEFEDVEMAEVRITIPASATPLSGKVDVVTSDYSEFSCNFGNDQTRSAQDASENVIRIDLGSRVAVKKITITVNKTADGYATVESIQFLKDVVSADPDSAASQVTGLHAVEGNEQVILTWNSLPNISGYLVSWYPAADPAKLQQQYVETNRLEIKNLENLVTYVFTVTAKDGDWTGRPSEAVTATPQPAGKPSAPDMVTVTALDGALSVSWKAAENATYYEVYYSTVENASSYTRWGAALTGTSTTITGLTNGVTYYIYVTAGNDVGVSGQSRTASGTPEAVDYSRPAGIPTKGILDYDAYKNIQLAAPNNWSRDLYPDLTSFDPWVMADGRYDTHWTMRTWSWNKHVIVDFEEPQNLTAAIWVPRLDGTYASNLRAYSVLVWLEGTDVNDLNAAIHVTPGTDNNSPYDTKQDWPELRGNASVNKFAVMPFTPQRGVVRISVAVEQRNYDAASLSELLFLKYDEDHRLPDDIAGLFTDELRTVLSPTATSEKIEALRARLNSDEADYYLDTGALADELDLAQELLNQQTGSSIFLNGLDSRSISRDSSAYGQSGSDLQPLGAAAAANTEITIYAQGIPAGETVTVYATQYNAEASAWRAEMGTLGNGRNVLTVPKIGSQNTPRGGSLYVSYSGSNAGDIRLHVRRATAIPVLDFSNWSAMSDTDKTQAASAYITALNTYLASAKITNNPTAWQNVTEIATPSVLLSLPATAVQSGLTGGAAQLVKSVEAWEELMGICRTAQGITGIPETRQNIRCMQMFTGAFMYAAGAHIGIGYDSCAGMVNGAPVSEMASDATANDLFGWGIAHEIGHNMDKLGKAEITNNIYSLAVQTYDGAQNTLQSRLEASGKYADIFNKTAQGYPGASSDVFVQLGLYWQLHLAYDDGDKPLDFYNRFFTAWKAGTYFNGATSYDDKVALTASGVTGYNLTEFFTRWGMTLSDGTKTKLATYSEESRAIWYLNDQSRRDRLSGASAATGTISVTAQKQAGKDGRENEVVLTITNNLNSGTVQGYEIYRGSGDTYTCIGFTTESTYTDTIGSGNNRTYTYTVVAYDTLGNRIGKDTTEEIRIAYDLTVSPSDYKGGIIFGSSKDIYTYTVTFPSATAVTGLKFLKLPDEVDTTNLQITITEDGETFTVGHTPDAYRKDSFITYFQRRNATDSQATQVWTYQADAITISGLPANLSLEDIQLISYMVDDISFWDGAEGPTMGILENDLTYGPSPENVIKAGTLVIVGNFRGDPTYSVVKLAGDFSNPDMAKADAGEAPGSAGDIRSITGYALLFADESSDGTYTNISDGIFIFVPDLEAEKELTEADRCGSPIGLPSRIRAELWRSTDPDDTDESHRTAMTLWINSPGGTVDDLPRVVVEGGGQ